MASALVIGGTGFVGRHAVVELLDHGYDVTVFSRNRRAVPTGPWEDVAHIEVDRTDSEALQAAADRVAPEVVIDCAVFHPDEARAAAEIFADVGAYVYVSSGGVYDRDDIPKREGVTPLHAYATEHGRDDSMASYGSRKAECDRIITAAGEQDVAAMSVRPTMIYGPKTLGPDVETAGSVSWAQDLPGIQNHHEYWITRIRDYDRVVVPGDGTVIWHRVFVEDVASALRIVAQEGTAGEAYNVADQLVLTMEDVIHLIAETLDTSVEVVHASHRELERVNLTPDDFVLYHHLGHDYPHVLSTCKIASLGWQSTPVDVAMERTVEEALASDRDGSMFDPGREREERFFESVGME